MQAEPALQPRKKSKGDLLRAVSPLKQVPSRLRPISDFKMDTKDPEHEFDPTKRYVHDHVGPVEDEERSQMDELEYTFFTATIQRLKGQ